MEHTYKITGMTCAGCQYKVQTLLSGVPGVQSVDINLSAGEAKVQMDTHVPTITLQNALKDYPKYYLSEAHEVAAAPSFSDTDTPKSWAAIYKPILLIFGYVLAVSLIVGYKTGSLDAILTMRIFMAGFFLVFSFFKMLNLDGFADSYAMYDVIARKFKSWGYIYAFIELGLGIAYVVNFNPLLTNITTIAVMGISIIGVLQSVLNKKAIRCACLGDVFNLPMSTVTIIEDGLMIAMAAGMLFML